MKESFSRVFAFFKPKNIASYFNFSERSTTFKKEILGGLSTFMAMAYILAVNPSILTGANGAKDYAGVFFLATAIASCVGTLAMGLFARVPVALAPGMGVNAFFAYTVASKVMGMTVADALVATFASGVLYAIIAVTPARLYIAKLLPKNFKLAIGAMIGLFLAYIGLSDSGIIASGAAPGGFVGTNTKLGNFSDPYVIIALITIALVFILHYLKVKGAALIAMLCAVGMVGIAYATNVVDSEKAFHLGKYENFGKFSTLSKDMWTSFGSTFANGKAYIAIFVFLYIDFFDTTGTLFSIGEQAKLNKEGDKWLAKANLVDAGATIFGSVMLTSTTTAYVESSVGVSQGARTGFSSLVVSLLFVISIAAWPVMTPFMPISHHQAGLDFQTGSVMPVTGPILVMVGALMLTQLKHFNWKQAIDIPVLFVTMVFGILSYSISTGMAAGIVLYYLLNSAVLAVSLIKKSPLSVEDSEIILTDNHEIVRNEVPDLKARVLNPVMIILFLLAVAYFATLPLYAY